MTDIRFNCPHCKDSLVVNERGAGMTVPCPNCNQPLIIPLLDPIPTAKAIAPSTPPLKPKKKPHKKREPKPEWQGYLDGLASDARREIKNVASEYDRPVSDFVSMRRVLTDGLRKHSRDGNWGLYRNATLHLAQASAVENHYEECLGYLLEVAFLDANGCSNDVAYGAKPFQKQFAFIIPYITGAIASVLFIMDRTEDSLYSSYTQLQHRYQHMNPPYPCDKSWSMLMEKIKEHRTMGCWVRATSGASPEP